MTSLEFLTAKYPERLYLTIEQLADELDFKNARSVHNAISAERFPIPTHRLANGKRVADIRDIASYYEGLRSS